MTKSSNEDSSTLKTIFGWLPGGARAYEVTANAASELYKYGSTIPGNVTLIVVPAATAVGTGVAYFHPATAPVVATYTTYAFGKAALPVAVSSSYAISQAAVKGIRNSVNYYWGGDSYSFHQVSAEDTRKIIASVNVSDFPESEMASEKLSIYQAEYEYRLQQFQTILATFCQLVHLYDERNQAVEHDYTGKINLLNDYALDTKKFRANPTQFADNFMEFVKKELAKIEKELALVIHYIDTNPLVFAKLTAANDEEKSSADESETLPLQRTQTLRSPGMVSTVETTLRDMMNKKLLPKGSSEEKPEYWLTRKTFLERRKAIIETQSDEYEQRKAAINWRRPGL